MLSAPIPTYDEYLKSQAAWWTCGNILTYHVCVHMYWLALQYSSLLTEEEVDILEDGLIRHLNKQCSC
jgi:hypothetical protein